MARFDAAGLHLRSTVSGAEVGLSLDGFGCADRPAAVIAVAPSAATEKNHLQFLRKDLTEWFWNGPLGIEHGFTVPRDPGCAAAHSLVFSLALSGDYKPTLRGDGLSIDLVEPKSGHALHYVDLFAFDAAGKDLPAIMALSADGTQLRLTVDTSGAQFPITVDPTFVEQAKLTASDGAMGDGLGFSVAVQGDTAIVGAINKTVGGNANQGQAYVYVRSGSMWTEQAILKGSDGAAMDLFGTSVAISGNTLLVGAPGKVIGGRLKVGQVYVFVGSGSMWMEQAILSASDFDGITAQEFGQSVSIDGDTAIVGANLKRVGTATAQGQAYVYVRSGTTWTEQAILKASDGAAGD